MIVEKTIAEGDVELVVTYQIAFKTYLENVDLENDWMDYVSEEDDVAVVKVEIVVGTDPIDITKCLSPDHKYVLASLI